MAAIIPIPAFRDNYIWLLIEGGNAVVIDPGDAGPVLAVLDREGLRLTAILNTHHHNDHVGGNQALLERHDVPVFGPVRERIPGMTRPLREGERVDVPGIGMHLDVLDVPGHTAGHIAYVQAATRGAAPRAFVGDTLFACGCGRLFEGSPGEMWSSLQKLAALPDPTEIYCAHEYTLANLRFAAAVEPDSEAIRERTERETARRVRGEPTVPSRLADERATNPFLRAGRPGVMRAAGLHAGRVVDDPVASFAVLRDWKDRF
ncbi:MAG: hydroxyacylglutathione hydrolase [Casimicrobiaceae bacterium]